MTSASGKRYETYEQGTPCGKLFRVLDTVTGRFVSMSYHPHEEAQKICDRLNDKLKPQEQRPKSSQ